LHVQKPQPPENIGHLNLYIRETTQYGSRRPPELIRVPIARYTRRRFRKHRCIYSFFDRQSSLAALVGPFMSFMPWIPILADWRTRQTVIYSSTGGGEYLQFFKIALHETSLNIVYILPPLFNAYGKVYSVAELIASGYASFASGIQLTNPFDITSAVQPNPCKLSFQKIYEYFHHLIVMGPGIPTINPVTGGFMGGIQTKYRLYFARRFSKTFNGKMSPRFQAQEKDQYRPQPYSRNNYDKSEPRSRHTGTTHFKSTTRLR
jgi:hypothetical protein